jgi:DNA-directed RNA polymerase subunit K/omega
MPPKKKGTKKKPKKKGTKKKPSKKVSKKEKKEEIEEENDLTDTEINNQNNDIEENSNSDSDNLDDDLPEEEEDEDLEEEEEDEESEIEEAEELFQEDYNLLLKQKDIDDNPDNKLDNDKMSIYEETRLIGTRSKQISTGAKAFIKNNDKLSSIEIAKEEFKNRLVPIELIRKMPNGTQEVWKVSQFK